jgi:tetratricopeptide (TPR) repeat protein
VAFAKAFPDNPSVAHDRVVSCMSFGLLLESRKKKESALAKYREAVGVSEKALAVSPADATMRRDLFVSYSRAGIVEYDLERHTEAHADFEKALVIAKDRFISENGNLQAVYDLADAHYHVSQTFSAEGRRDEAKLHLLASGDMARRAAAIDPNANQTKEFLKRVDEALKK